jgi:Uri superfamily endonuclease
VEAVTPGTLFADNLDDSYYLYIAIAVCERTRRIDAHFNEFSKWMAASSIRRYARWHYDMPRAT